MNMKMAVDYDNRQCRIAAEMLGTQPNLLDSDLVVRLNRADELLAYVDLEEGRPTVLSPGDIALVIMIWWDRRVEDERFEAQIEINDLINNWRNSEMRG